VRGRTRWQHDRPVAGGGELRREFAGGLAVEADRPFLVVESPKSTEIQEQALRLWQRHDLCQILLTMELPKT